MKIVINRRYGGFSLSRAAFLRLREMGCALALAEVDPLSAEYTDHVVEEHRQWCEKYDRPFDIESARKSAELGIRIQQMCGGVGSYLREIPRADPMLVRAVEELGDKSSGSCAGLEIVEIPDGVAWEIDEYDGMERVHETHRSWP